MMNNKYVSVCPNCGSINLKSRLLLNIFERTRIIVLNTKYKSFPGDFGNFLCKDCDYYGICPEMEVKKVGEFKKMLKNKNKNKLTKKK